MTISPVPDNGVKWASALEEAYQRWETEQTYEAEVQLFTGLERVFRRTAKNEVVPPNVLESANRALAQMMADVAHQKDSFALSNEIRVINDLVEFGLWRRFAEDPTTNLFLASLCLTYADVLDSLYQLTASFPVLDTLLRSWTGRPFVSTPGTLVNDVTNALFGPAWALLYGDELHAGSESYEDLSRLQPPFVFEYRTALPVVSLPCDWGLNA